MKVNVTAEDIARGIRVSANSCPVARALQRCTGDRLATVDGSRATVNYHRNFARFRLPPEVSYFVSDFDAGRPVAPFSFEFEVTP